MALAAGLCGDLHAWQGGGSRVLAGFRGTKEGGAGALRRSGVLGCAAPAWLGGEGGGGCTMRHVGPGCTRDRAARPSSHPMASLGLLRPYLEGKVERQVAGIMDVKVAD